MSLLNFVFKVMFVWIIYQIVSPYSFNGFPSSSKWNSICHTGIWFVSWGKVCHWATALNTAGINRNNLVSCDKYIHAYTAHLITKIPYISSSIQSKWCTAKKHVHMILFWSFCDFDDGVRQHWKKAPFLLLKKKVKYLITIKIKRQRFASLQSFVRKKVKALLVDNKVKEKKNAFDLEYSGMVRKKKCNKNKW